MAEFVEPVFLERSAHKFLILDDALPIGSQQENSGVNAGRVRANVAEAFVAGNKKLVLIPHGFPEFVVAFAAKSLGWR